MSSAPVPTLAQASFPGTRGLLGSVCDRVMRDPIESCHPCRLERIYEQRFGGGGASSGSSASAVSLEEAQRNCMHSVAAYAVVQYILQLKVRLRFRVSAAPYGTQMARQHPG